MQSNAKQVLLVSSEPPEIRVAELCNGLLSDLFVERGGHVLNNIYRGRVANVVKGMDAAFVDIGLARNALMHSGDVGGKSTASGDISSLIKEGQEVLVQIARPPVGSKGARVTTRLALAGRYVVLSIDEDNVGVSRRIESEEERVRLRKLAERLRPLDHGLIVRTEAEGISEAELAGDIRTISLLIQKIRAEAGRTSAPALIHREAGLLGRLVRDCLNENTSEVWVDTREEFESLLALTGVLAPHLQNRIQLYTESVSLFEKFNVTSDIARSQERIVTLPHGGSLIIDEAEALCAIDVNTARFVGKNRLSETVLQTNLEAVEEAARQIRLRDIGGVIVIDFIDMERHKDRVRVLDHLEAALKKDHTRTRIVQLSPSGLVEITRRREGHSLRQLLNRPCPYCAASGVIKSATTKAIEVRRELREAARLSSAPALPCLITLHPEVACAFLGLNDEYVRALENAIATQIFVQVDSGLHLEAHHTSSLDVETIQRLSQSPWQAGMTLQVPSQIATYPAKEPQFIAWNNRLIRFENVKNLQEVFGKNSSGRTNSIVKIALSQTGRWYCTATLLSDEAPEDR